MQIERYSDQYAEDVKRLVRSFQDEALSDYGLSLEEYALANTIEQLKYQAFILILDGKCEGVLAGKEVTTPLSNDKIWHEVIWYVSQNCRRYGLRLFNTARAVLKAEGYTAMVMVYMHNSKSDKLHRLYTRMGFRAMETNWIGRI